MLYDHFNTLRPFALFYGNLVYVMAIFMHITPILVYYIKKNLATLLSFPQAAKHPQKSVHFLRRRHVAEKVSVRAGIRQRDCSHEGRR
jgi:hypothetical protein